MDQKVYIHCFWEVKKGILALKQKTDKLYLGAVSQLSAILKHVRENEIKNYYLKVISWRCDALWTAIFLSVNLFDA